MNESCERKNKSKTNTSLSLGREQTVKVGSLQLAVGSWQLAVGCWVIRLDRRGITVCKSGSHWGIKSLGAAVVQFQLFLLSPDSTGERQLTSVLCVVTNLSLLHEPRSKNVAFSLCLFLSHPVSQWLSCLQLTRIDVLQLS